MASFPQPEDKDPSAVLDYLIDLAALTNGSGTSDYLQTGETIASIVSVVSSDPTVLIIDSYELANSNTSIKIWISGGVHGNRYTVTARFTTSVTGRIDDRSFNLRVLNK